MVEGDKRPCSGMKPKAALTKAGGSLSLSGLGFGL